MFKKLFSFHGRARRKEFWKIQAIVFISYFIAGVLVAIVFPKIPEDEVSSYILLFGFIALVFFIPLGIINWAVTIRRLHDINMSGWYSLILIALLIFDKSGISGLIAVIILGSIPSTQKDTKWDDKETHSLE